MKTNRKVICSSSAVRYAETLFELNIPKETIEKTREIFSEVPQITDVGQSDDSSREEGTGHR